MNNTVFGKVTIYSDSDFSKRASVFLNPDGTLNALEYRKEVYESSDEFEKVHNYSLIVSSDKRIREALSARGFKVRGMERINTPFHLLMPGWMLDRIDLLRKKEYINFSRSDLINKIILDNMSSVPPEYPYEKDMVKTTFTINPVALNGIERLESSRTRNHLIYDYVREFLERNP